MLILQTRSLNTLRNARTVTELHNTVFLNAVPDTFLGTSQENLKASF